MAPALSWKQEQNNMEDDIKARTARRLARQLVKTYGKKEAKSIARMRVANYRNQPELKSLYQMVLEMI